MSVKNTVRELPYAQQLRNALAQAAEDGFMPAVSPEAEEKWVGDVCAVRGVAMKRAKIWEDTASAVNKIPGAILKEYPRLIQAKALLAYADSRAAAKAALHAAHAAGEL